MRLKKNKILKMAVLTFSTAVLLATGTPIGAKAAEQDVINRIEALKTKYPHGKYWNHRGLANDNSDGYTSLPCELHKVQGIHVNGTNGCTCNHFSDAKYDSRGQKVSGHYVATQCMGFANKLGYDVFGDTAWYQYGKPSAAQIANIKVGDIVRLTNHSVFVVAKNGNVITIAEANYPNGCQINWGRTVDLSKNTVEYYEHAGNYDSITGNGGGNSQSTEGQTNPDQPAANQSTTQQTTTQQPTTETVDTTFTGWKKTSDGVYYEYYISGKLQKSSWISKKKYYVNENGYRVTGIVEIQGYHYFFNEDGVKQKKKWIECNGKDYYACSDGSILKNQWLYKGNDRVYVKKDGSIAKAEIVKIGKKKYAFDAKGKRSAGFKKINGKYYYSNSSGVISKKKWIKVKKKTYYVQKSGVRATSQMLKIGAYQYYFDKKGRLQKNKEIILDGVIYKADKKGRCRKTGVVKPEENQVEQNQAN